MSCILAIDDRPINRQFLASLLKYGGHEIIEAADGKEALEIVRQRNPDLIVTDIKMPNMDGYEFVNRLRHELEPDTARTPVIFYTALYHELEARKVAESYGVTDIITKPAEPEEILRKVNLALGKWGATRNRVSNRGELEALQATSLKLAALIELGMELNSERDTKKLLGRFCSTARHIIGTRKSMLGILSDDGDGLRHFFINGIKDGQPVISDRPPVHQHSVLATIVNERKVVRVNHAQASLDLQELSLSSSPIRSILGVPLMSGARVYGWLVLLEKQNGSNFDEEDERIASTLGAQAAVAYENAVFAERLEHNAQELDRTRREQLEMKDQFISHVSHELRSPLAALHQFTTIVLDGIAGEINDQQREYLDIILKNSLQLRDMIGDLLDVTRAEGGKLTLDLKPVWLCELFQTSIQRFERRAAEKGLAFPETCFGCSPNLSQVYADPDRLQQVLSNLLDNALKFTSAGQVSVSCDEDDRAGFVRISVSDSGCGIDENTLPKIFDRLYQSPNSIECSRKGLGLGLHISKQLVELHGGRIWAESELGKGTTVFFTVPVANESEEAKAA